MNNPVLSADQRRTLEAVCGTLTPESEDGLAAELMALCSEAASPEQMQRLRLALSLFGSRLVNGLLTGRFRRLDDLDAAARERVLRAWAGSRLGQLRAGFQAFKRLALLLYHARLDPRTGHNPHWKEVGYPPPPGPGQAAEQPLSVLQVDKDTTLDADVVVIGSGAGGGVMAAELAAAGRRVVVLEKGGYYREPDFDGAELPALQRLFEGRGLLATRDLGVVLLAGSNLGGGTTVNWMTSLPTPEHVLRQWHEELGIRDATSPEWQAGFEVVCQRLNVHCEEGRHNPHNQRLIDGCRKLGYHWRVLPRNERGCPDCSLCSLGCRFGGKQGTLKTYLRDAHDRGAVLVAGCHVERITIHSGVATGIEGRVNGHRLSVRGRIVVAAGGSVQTPALLLRSGLSNRNIGRHLHLHPTVVVFGFYDQPIEGWHGAIQTAACDQYANLDAGYGFIVEVAPVLPGLVALALPWRDAQSHHRLMRQLPSLAVFIAITRDRDSGQVRIDGRGQPVVDYTVSSYDAAHVLRGAEEAVRLHAAAGAHTISGPFNSLPDLTPRSSDLEAHLGRFARIGVRKNDLTLFSAHQMSSCRMGGNPRQAAVNPDGETWEVRGLFVADGSALPTSTGVNPMISIMALAYRNAQIIKARL